MGQDRASLVTQIADVKARLTEARARIPKHTPPPALMVEIDELEEELMRLQALLRGDRAARIADLQKRLAEARARIPKHTPPPALMVEIDELEEELEELRAQGGT